MMNRLFKILPILAIVVGIGGAWANQADESPCEASGTQGYLKENPADPTPPSLPPTNPNSGMVSGGQFEIDFNCKTDLTETCHWVYAPENPEAENGWIECRGIYQSPPED